jgi:hypothetical protein
MVAAGVIAALVITDGRNDLLKASIESFEERVSGPIIERFIYDDSGSRRSRELVAEMHPRWTLINHPTGERQGFAGAIRTAWDALRRESIADWVLHLEGDFTFNRDIHLEPFRDVMTKRPNLAQMALVRQAWNDEEVAAGGVIQVQPDEFVTHMDRDDNVWLEHNLFFTTNPSLYQRSLIEMFDWPAGPQSEGRFSAKLREAGFTFGYWGAKDDPPAVHHIGHTRVGMGY